MTDPTLKHGLAMIRALAALKIKHTARVVGTNEGTEIHQPGKPTLLLTWEAADEFARQIGEAEFET